MTVLIRQKKTTANTLATEETGETGVGKYVTRTTVQRWYKSAVGAVSVLLQLRRGVHSQLVHPGFVLQYARWKLL